MIRSLGKNPQKKQKKYIGIDIGSVSVKTVLVNGISFSGSEKHTIDDSKIMNNLHFQI